MFFDFKASEPCQYRRIHTLERSPSNNVTTNMVAINCQSRNWNFLLGTRIESYKPAVRIIVEAMDRAITTTEADIVKASNCQATVCANIHKEFLLPSLLQTTASRTRFKTFH
jgi:hypothetical protein